MQETGAPPANQCGETEHTRERKVETKKGAELEAILAICAQKKRK